MHPPVAIIQYVVQDIIVMLYSDTGTMKIGVFRDLSFLSLARVRSSLNPSIPFIGSGVPYERFVAVVAEA